MIAFDYIVDDAEAVLSRLAPGSVDCFVTSPPYYGLRSYSSDSREVGIEDTPEAYVERIVSVCRAMHRALSPSGSLWLNIGDSYANDGKWGGRSGGKHARALHGADSGIGRAKRRTGLPPKSLIGIPWRVALALQNDGWTLRSDIIWHKPSVKPERVRDRPTMAHEYVFLLTKQAHYYYDYQAVSEPTVTQRRPQRAVALRLFREAGFTDEHLQAVRACGISDTGKTAQTQSGTGANRDEAQRLAADVKAALGGYYRELLTAERRNARSVWSLRPADFNGAHFAVMPLALAERCILAGCPEGGLVADPFAGAGTTGIAALRHRRRFLGIDLVAANRDLALQRVNGAALPLFSGSVAA